jgi:hypothetical protein
MKMTGTVIGLSALALLLGGACSGSESTPTGSSGAAAGSGGAPGSGGASNGGAPGSGGASNGGAPGSGGAPQAGAQGSGGVAQGGSGGAGLTGGTAGTAGATGAGGSAVDSGKDVIVAADAKDVSGDAAWGACCHQIPHDQCRFPMNNWQTCWACDPGCYDAIRPTTPVAPITKCNCDGRPAGNRCMKIENRCSFQVRATMKGLTKDLQPGDCTTGFVADGTRVEGTTGCETGKCDPAVPHTLAELNLGALDWYDLSHVDGANLPFGMYLVKGTFSPPAKNTQCDCQDRECRVDIKNTTCLPKYQLKNAAGKVYACKDMCISNPDPTLDQACCRGQWSAPKDCLPATPTAGFVMKDEYSMFRFPCPQVYSFAYDEEHEVDGQYVLCTCPGGKIDYDFIFCP